MDNIQNALKNFYESREMWKKLGGVGSVEWGIGTVKMRDTLHLIHTLSEVPVTATLQVIKEVPAVENTWKKIFIEALYTIKPCNAVSESILITFLLYCAGQATNETLELIFEILAVLCYLKINRGERLMTSNKHTDNHNFDK